MKTLALWEKPIVVALIIITAPFVAVWRGWLAFKHCRRAYKDLHGRR